MVLDNLGESLRDSLDALTGERTVDEDSVQDVVQDVQRSLLQSDVDVSLVQEVADNIEERATNEDPPAGISARDHVRNIVYEELVDVVGDGLEFPLEQQTILLAGLQGSGKTTSSAKMAWWFAKKGLRPAIIQTDTHRPGAYDQSKQMAERAEVDFYGDPDVDDPVEVVREGFEQTADADVHIVDTEGRHALEDQLISQLERLHGEVNPDRTLLVLDAATGKSAKDQANAFDDAVGVDGIVLTKMDGTAKGGGALTAVNETDTGIAFVGTGEEVRDIERFETEGYVSRLLGMGDLRQLQERVERAEHATEDEDWDPEDALEGDFTLYDMRKQLETMNEMGPLSDVMNMIPGMGGNIQNQLQDADLNVQQEKFDEWRIVMQSMTEEELENPGIIGNSRVERIALGSGTDEDTVEELLEHYNRMSSIFNRFDDKRDLQRVAKQMQGQAGGRGGLGNFF